MVQLSAMPALMANSTAARFSTGSAPGIPRHTGQTFVLGGAPKLAGQPQKILVAVASWTCTSRPITGSYLAIASGSARSRVAIGDHYIAWPRAADPEVRRTMKIVHHIRRD